MQPTVFRFDVLQLDDQAAHVYKDQLASLAEAVGAGELRLDFAQVEWISSTALSMLIGLHRRLARSEGRLVLCNVSDATADLFRLTRLDSLLDIQPARPQPDRSISASA
jgi:anti-anti-sigma factor